MYFINVAATNIQVRVIQSGNGVLTGICDALNLTIEANNVPELHATFVDAVNTLFIDLIEEGEFASFLTKMHWKPVALPADMSRGVHFNVPYEVVGEHAVHA